MKLKEDCLLKVLLVDDEPFIRKGLTALIDWEEEGYLIAGEAHNGCQAVELLKEQDYDLIISDIKMPDMDGIALADYVKRNAVSTVKFIFLSGFYDFQYAKSAIQAGCCDYVLKPIQKEELLSILRRIMSEIQKEEGGRRNKKIWEKAYLDRNLSALLWGKYDEINVKDTRTRMRLTGEMKYIHVEISLKDDNFSALPEEKKRQYQRKMYNYAGLLMKNYADHIIFDVAKQTECYDIGIIYCDSMAKEKRVSDEEWLSWLLYELKERTGYGIVACSGSVVHRIEDIAVSYREAAMTRFLRFFKKDDKKINLTAFKKKNSDKNVQDEYYRKELDTLVHAIEIGDKSYIRENSGILYRRMLDKCIDTQLMGMNLQYFLYRLLGLAYEMETEINQEEVMQYIQEAAFAVGSYEFSGRNFQKFAEDYSEYLQQLRQTSVKGTMSTIEAEIEQNYADNLSLKTLGEKYYINSAYLGQIFKKQYGCSFKDYVNGVRIRKAAELLLRTEEKVYEISEKVGYKNMEYFINKFEGIYGVTPTRFRKRNLV